MNSAPPDPLALLRGLLLKRGGEGKGYRKVRDGKREGREGERRGREEGKRR